MRYVFKFGGLTDYRQELLISRLKLATADGAADFGLCWQSHMGVENSPDPPEAFVYPVEVLKSMVPHTPPPTPFTLSPRRPGEVVLEMEHPAS